MTYHDHDHETPQHHLWCLWSCPPVARPMLLYHWQICDFHCQRSKLVAARFVTTARFYLQPQTIPIVPSNTSTPIHNTRPNRTITVIVIIILAQFTELHAAVTVWSTQSNTEFQLTPTATGIIKRARGWKRKDRQCCWWRGDKTSIERTFRHDVPWWQNAQAVRQIWNWQNVPQQTWFRCSPDLSTRTIALCPPHPPTFTNCTGLWTILNFSTRPLLPVSVFSKHLEIASGDLTSYYRLLQPKSAVTTPLLWIWKIGAISGYSHSFRITCDMSAVSLLESRE